MRTRFLGIATAALVLSSLGLAPAANAADAPPWPVNCVEGAPVRPALGTVYTDSTGLHVNVNAAPSDVEAVSQWAVDLSLHIGSCLASRVPTEPVFCYAAIATNVGSYVNVEGTQIDVYYPALLAAITDCTLSG